MARKKKVVEPIVGPGKDPETKLTVQKSLPLFSLWRSDMSLSEFKILDTYLSRINSHDPGKRTVVFTKGDLEKLLGVKKINKAELVSRLKGLGRFVDLEQANSKKVHQVALFEEAYGEMDENGLWTVKLTCTAKAMKYVFNVEKLGYFRYKLRCITSLTSRYTYIFFMYLESNRFRKSWEVDLPELRQILNCDQDELYQEFKFFNQRILKRCQKELLDKTECRYTYEPIKKGRRVVTIRFTLEPIREPLDLPMADPNQVSFDDIETAAAADERDGAVWEDALEPLQLTNEQLDGIQAHLVLVDPSKLPELPQFGNDIELRRYHYLAIKVAEMGRREGIKDKYAYLIGILRHDAAEQ